MILLHVHFARKVSFSKFRWILDLIQFFFSFFGVKSENTIFLSEKTPLKIQFLCENEMTAQYKRAWRHEREEENDFFSLSSRSSLPSSLTFHQKKKVEISTFLTYF